MQVPYPPVGRYVKHTFALRKERKRIVFGPLFIRRYYLIAPGQLVHKFKRRKEFLIGDCKLNGVAVLFGVSGVV